MQLKPAKKYDKVHEVSRRHMIELEDICPQVQLITWLETNVLSSFVQIPLYFVLVQVQEI